MKEGQYVHVKDSSGYYLGVIVSFLNVDTPVIHVVVEDDKSLVKPYVIPLQLNMHRNRVTVYDTFEEFAREHITALI